MSALALEVDPTRLKIGDVLRDESTVATKPLVGPSQVTVTVRHANGVLAIRCFPIGGSLVRVARPIVWPEAPDRPLPYDAPYDGPIPEGRPDMH